MISDCGLRNECKGKRLGLKGKGPRFEVRGSRLKTPSRVTVLQLNNGAAVDHQCSVISVEC